MLHSYGIYRKLRKILSILSTQVLPEGVIKGTMILIQGQRPDMEFTDTHNKEQKITKNKTYIVTK